MIRINKSLKQLDSLATQHLALILKHGFLNKAKLEANSIDANRGSWEQEFFKHLHKNLSRIIRGRPDKLESMINQLHIFFQQVVYERLNRKGNISPTADDVKVEKSILKIELEAIFDYEKFTSDKKARYAYSLAKRMNVSVCLYCNQQYTLTISSDHGKTRPQFDHFFDQGNHPCFRLSFYNLIPSCPTCNSPGVKGTKPFLPSKNIHPLIEDFDGVYDFRININSIDFVEGRKRDFTIKLKRTCASKTDSRYLRSAENARIFLINESYQNHKGYVSDLIRRHHYYESGRFDDLRNFETGIGNAMFDSDQQALESVIGIPLSKEMKTKRILTKLHLDIADQLGTFSLISKKAPI